MIEQSFSVTGLRCEGCVQTVTTALTGLRPVEAVRIDLNADGPSTVHVSTETELTRQQVQAALSGGGNFSVVD